MSGSEELDAHEKEQARREAVMLEAGRLYSTDSTIRRICDSLVIEAMEKIASPDAERVHDAVRSAIMQAVAMVAGKGTDANMIMVERDSYRDRILEMASLSPGIPVYRHPDATDEVLGKK